MPEWSPCRADAELCKKMRYRDLGKTGMKVSILSYGASSLGSVYRCALRVLRLKSSALFAPVQRPGLS